MEFQRYSFFKVLTFTLPLFCLLVTWAASTAITTAGPPSPPVSSVNAGAEILRSRGYSLIASTLLSAVPPSDNFSGTIFALPDFAVTFAVSKFSPNRRPTASFLLYHTLRRPLQWRNLSSLVDGYELPTLLSGNCLFVRNFNGEVSISASRKQISAVRILQPDIYADDHLVVHGIDGILDPTSASKCSVSKDRSTAVQPPRVDRKVLDHAVRAIRRRGFTVAATAMSIKRQELLRLGAISLFVPSDRVLFSNPNEFRFNIRRHIVPQRHRFDDLGRYPPKITVFQTLAESRTLTVDSLDGDVTVNGVKVNSTEVYQNRWIVVFSISASLDDASATAAALPVPPLPCGEVQYPDPIYAIPPPSNAFPEVETPSPATTPQCRISDFPVEIEGGDLLCPLPARTLLEERDSSTAVGSADEDADDVSQSSPLFSYTVLSGLGDEDQMRAPSLNDPLNIADDLFFYS